MQVVIRGQADNKKPGKAFIPTGQIKPCNGGCFTFKCNECKYKLMAGSLLTNLDRTKGEGKIAKEKAD